MGVTIRTSSSSSPTAQYLDPVWRIRRQDFFDIGDTERSARPEELADIFFAFGVGGA